MTLTVENGDIVSGADTYVSLADYAAYAANLGWTLRDTDAENEIDLRRAFQSLNRQYSYSGDKVDDAQVGAFPRTEQDGIPVDIVFAQMELAYLIKGGLDPFATIEASKTVDRKKVGPIETSTTTLPTGAPRLTSISGLLGKYLKAGSGAGQIALVRG